MKIDIMNINKFIEANHCPEVKNPVFFNYDTTPTADGLFSYELFGVSDEDRKNIFGYINLNFNAIHPMVFNLLNSRLGSFKFLLNGTKYAVIENKKIKFVDEDFPGAETGSDFLYDHFDEISWIDAIEEEEIESLDKKTRLKFLQSLKKDEFFINKWLVLPPFYRAENSTDKTMGDQINKLYKELILKTRSLKTGFSFSLFSVETKIRIQNILKDLYLSTIAPASGKNLVIEKGRTEGTLVGAGKTSMIRKHLIGKTIDWTASSVITAPHNSLATKFEQKPVPFGYSCFPLATLISLFQPFFVYGMNQYLEMIITQFKELNGARIQKINIDQFNSEEIGRMIKRFIKTPKGRFEPITIKYRGIDNSDYTAIPAIYEYKTKQDFISKKNYIERDLTLTDLLYLVAKDALKDKHVYITRYPITDIQSIFPAKVKVLSTTRTHETYLSLIRPEDEELIKTKPEDAYYPEYPNIPYIGAPYNQNNVNFFDVMILGNEYIASMGADYDGDMLYLKSVFSKEANAEAERLIWSKTNMLNARGELSRSITAIGKDCCVGLFELTKSVDN